ncbi:hypothetical protein H2198_006200 [Neophaeococcomyces mojaviensis]|uniref:Uncharacterized protein n=1 Tax=Neophaeococcomyces mojaviensis TaxID=3383035 RepID=A0ACC3A3T4_9EURO|nr:hypothetical protein H2198_006200 [Knufia sp. JES_112]
MAAKTLTARNVARLTAWVSSSRPSPRSVLPFPTRRTILPVSGRNFSHHTQLRVSIVSDSNAGVEAHPRGAVPPEALDSGNTEQDTVRHASYLGEADSNDGHDTVREVYGAPAPPLDASKAAFLGESDSNDAFETRRDLEGRKLDPVDASTSSFLGEHDSDDGFEGRRVAYPEEGDHRIEDTSGSGIHGQIGEGDTFIEEARG